jgi:hypothetical protein
MRVLRKRKATDQIGRLNHTSRRFAGLHTGWLPQRLC